VQTGPRLEPVTQENVRAACRLTMRPGQEDLVAPVAFSLADAYTVPDIAWPRLIYDGGDLVGFVMAAFASGERDRMFHSYLWRLNIGAGYQGKGYGRFAVDQVCAEALRRGHGRLTVSYQPYEHGPAGFYQRLGFTPTGEVHEGEVVAERVLGPAPGPA
jgi:diamine N-acetyltransferase